MISQPWTTTPFIRGASL
jgi:large subunit ribosomal protein L4